jgi:phosphatidylethanolamine/phosphatidyl-N-methylethanolamine N-methyltransferase
MHDNGKSTQSAVRTTAAPIGDDGLNAAFSAQASDAANRTDIAAFVRQFLHDPKGVAAIVPSSRWLEQRIVRNAVITQAATVVELGPGTGGTTRALLRAMSPQARLLSIELNPQFHAHISKQIRDTRLHVECGSAERITEFLEARRLPAADAIVSGIPFSTMPPQVSERIATAVAAALRPGGRFVAYQWTPWVARFTTPHLGEPKLEWELANMPPMRVYTWVKSAA